MRRRCPDDQSPDVHRDHGRYRDLAGERRWAGGQAIRPDRLALALSATTSAHIQGTLRDQLQSLGWVEGRNLSIELRYAEGDATRLPELARELVRLEVDVIVAGSTPAALAAKAATSTAALTPFPR